MSQQNFYDNYWKRNPKRSLWSESDFKRVLGILEGRRRVLDYGCGMGHKYRDFLLQSVENYAGADVSKIALESLLQSGCEAFAIDTENGTINADAQTFDGAVCSEVFEHLFDPLAAAKELHRVLLPGSPLVVTVPNFGFHPWRIMALLRARVPLEPDNNEINPFNGVHIRYFSVWTLRQMLEMAGFEVVTMDSYIRGSVWDVFRVLGPLSKITRWANRYLPDALHLRFLSDFFPGVFAERIRAVCIKRQ